MGVITAPFTATVRHSLQLQIHNGPFDAVPVHDGPLSSTLRRRTKRDKPKDSQDNPPPPPPPKDTSSSSSSQDSDSGDEGTMCTTHTGRFKTHTFCNNPSSQTQDQSSSTFSALGSDPLSTESTSESPTGSSAASSTTRSFPASPTDNSTISGIPPTTLGNGTASSPSPGTLTSQTSSLIPPSSLSVPTSTSGAEANINSSPASTSSSAARVQSTNKAGPIAGGVIGGLILILLFILGTILFLRRRRRKRTPASAEFRDRYIPRSHVVTPLAMQGSSEYLDDRDPPDAPPPPFTQGDYSDPLFEKIAETRQAHMQYGFTR